MVNDFLLEIGSEELPPKALLSLADALAAHIEDGLKAAELTFEKTERFATPRRLAVRVSGLQSRQADRDIERRGPALAAAYDANGQPTPAAKGFARSCGVEVNQLQTIQESKGEWLVYRQVMPGQSVQSILGELVNDSIKKLPIPKLMRWGNGDVQFARPVHWVVMLYGDEVVQASVLGLTAGACSYGHRFHHPTPITLTHPRQYEAQLEAAYVIADFEERKTVIQSQIEACAASYQAAVIKNDDLLEEVTAIVEWPSAVVVDFDPAFLAVPKEALIASMASHQKCFSLQNDEGDLLPHFITVANIESQAKEQIIKGNEKVMRARLSDAAFFYQKDKQTSLADKAKRLKHIVFQAKLGTLQDKVTRLEHLAVAIAAQLGFEQTTVARAAQLAKSTLVTDMVGEFPELQDVMGYYYALHDGESEQVAIALKEHYLPRYSGDVLPQSEAGVALALADRIDTMVGIFGINQKPTGVKDPFQLRRSALGIIRILIEGDWNISLTSLLKQSIASYGSVLTNKSTEQDVCQFVLDRLYVYLTSQCGVRHDVVKAVLAVQTDQLNDVVKRIDALTQFVSHSADITALIQGFKRVSNIVKKASPEEMAQTVNVALFEQTEEQQLHHVLCEQRAMIEQSLTQGAYARVLEHLAAFKGPVDAFFDHVRVNTEDKAIQQNRLALLVALQHVFLKVADLALLQE